MTRDRIRIWFVITALTLGGTERTLIALLEALDRDKYEVTLWTITDEGTLHDSVPKYVTVRSLGISNKWDLHKTVTFLREARGARPDILQGFLFFDNVLVRLAGIVSPTSTVISGVRSVPENPNRVRALIDSLTISLTDYVVSNSTAGRELAIRRGARTEDVLVIQNGRRIERFTGRREPDDLRNELGIPSSATVVGTVGRYVESKGHLELIDAWASLNPNPEDLVLILVGYGPERERLEAYSKSYGVDDSVILTGRRDDVPDLLSLMDIFVFSSRHEGFSGALLEAMAAGLGIVATPVGGNTDMITDGETGLLVPVRDSDAMRQAIRSLVDDPDTRRALGAAASRKARDEFSLEAMTNSFEALYDEVSA